MPITRRSAQVLSYLKPAELDELQEAVDELETSRADWIRQAILEALERRRQGQEALAAAGEFVIEVG